MFAPVAGDFGIDLTGVGVPELSRVAVRTGRAECGVKRVQLPAGAAARAEHGFLPDEFLHGGEEMVVREPADGSGKLLKRPDIEIRVLVRVYISQLEGVKIHRVGTETQGATEVLRVENLLSEGHPSACRSTKQDARPGLADGAKLLFDRRIELLG